MRSEIERHLLRRPRRLRHSLGMRRMLAQVQVNLEDLIYPIFVTHENEDRTEIPSMPGQFRVSVEESVNVAKQVMEAGIPAIVLFGIPHLKDATGTNSYDNDGIVQQAIREIKWAVPDLIVIADACLCEYTDHGHCGLIKTEDSNGLPKGHIDNDKTLEFLGQIAIAQAKAGADIIAPSGMMDGMCAAIRSTLDAEGYSHIPIMPYSVKYASAFYGPFRDAADGAPKSGDRKSHQMDFANLDQALLEAELDVEQGADFLMVKPAMAYLDILVRLKLTHPAVPLVAYNVSGEFSMVKAAAGNNWLDERQIVIESLTAMKRAGADLIITYHALDFAKWMNHDKN